MKKTLVVVGGAIALVAVGWAVVRSRRPALPEMQDKLGIFPAIPAEKRSIPELKRALADGDPKVRRESLRVFGRLMDHGELAAAEAAPLFVGGIGDPDPGVRAVGAAYLSSSRVDPAAAVPVLTALLKDPDGLVRMNAVMGLSNHWAAAEPAVPAMLEVWNDPNPDVRVHTAEALLHFPAHRYTPPEAWAHLSTEEAKERCQAMGVTAVADGLERAVKGNDLAGVYLLLKSGADPNARKSSPPADTPLFRVYSLTRPEIVRFLLDSGADPSLKDQFGRSAWDAVSRNFSDPSFTPFGQESLEMVRAAMAHK